MSLWERVGALERQTAEPFLRERPVRVGALAEALGLEVIRSPLPPNISGLIQPSQTARSGFQIRVNKYEVPERQRFTVAHEIGHFLLHREDIGQGVVDSVMYRSALTSRKEVEANRIAADIVMPSALVREEAASLASLPTVEKVSRLAALFKVSGPAMRVRLGLT